MKQVVNPAPTEDGQQGWAVEDVEITVWVRDDRGNTALQRTKVDVPANCGAFAKDAMMMGFFVYFDEMVNGQTEVGEGIKSACAENLSRFSEIIEKTKAAKAAESASPIIQPAPEA